jgi:hypothetical protein
MTCPSLLVMTGWQVALAAVTGSPPCMHSMSIPLSCVLCARCCPCMHSACIVCMHSVPSAMAELTPCHALPYWRLAGRWRWLLWRGPCHAQYDHPAEPRIARPLPPLHALAGMHTQDIQASSTFMSTAASTPSGQWLERLCFPMPWIKHRRHISRKIEGPRPCHVYRLTTAESN